MNFSTIIVNVLSNSIQEPTKRWNSRTTHTHKKKIVRWHFPWKIKNHVVWLKHFTNKRANVLRTRPESEFELQASVTLTLNSFYNCFCWGHNKKKNLNLVFSPVSGPDIPSRHKSICPVTCILQRAENLQGFVRALLLTLHTPLGSAFESQSEENGAWAWHEGIIPAKRKKFNRFSLRKDGVGGRQTNWW